MFKVSRFFAAFRLFSELRLKTEGVSQKVAKVAKVWR